MRLQQFFVVYEHFHNAGGKDLHEVFVYALFFVVGTAENADPGKMLGKLFRFFHTFADFLCQPGSGAFLAQTGGNSDIRLVI